MMTIFGSSGSGNSGYKNTGAISPCLGDFHIGPLRDIWNDNILFPFSPLPLSLFCRWRNSGSKWLHISAKALELVRTWSIFAWGSVRTSAILFNYTVALPLPTDKKITRPRYRQNSHKVLWVHGNDGQLNGGIFLCDRGNVKWTL